LEPAGLTPFGHQWRFNQAGLSAATNTSLALTDVQFVTDASTGGAARFYRVRALYAPPPRIGGAVWMTNAASFGFGTVAGANYVVEYKTNLTDRVWLELSRQSGTGSPIQVTDPSPPGRSRFYRVRVE
jgi:hypothetical protein